MEQSDLSKTISDAQAFIDSVKEFQHPTSKNKPTSGEPGGPYEFDSALRDSGSDSSGSLDSSLQDNLKSFLTDGSELQVSNNLSAFPLNGNGSGTSVHDVENKKNGRPPVGSSISGFKTISFSQKENYSEPFRVDVLTFVEVYYYENKRLPPANILHEHFKAHPDRPNFLKGWNTVLDSISDSLLNRGIKPYNTVDNYVDPKFAWATSLIVNHLDKRTIPAKLKEAGLTTKEWQAFLRRKRHFDYFQSRLDEVFDNDVKNDAKIAPARSIQNGDLQAIKYYNELKNIYRPETQNALQMVSIVLTAVMEILAQHVESTVLNRVAAEIRTSPSVRKIIEIENK
jgi:hypothetical protein